MRRVLYMAHPVAPTEEELAAIPMYHTDRQPGEYVLDFRTPIAHAERVALAVKANIARALRWLSWLGRSFPETTFIAPWIAAMLSGENDADPAQREAGLVSCCATVERCDGIAMTGGRIGSGGARERDHGIANMVAIKESMSGIGIEEDRLPPMRFDVYDLTWLGAEPVITDYPVAPMTFVEWAKLVARMGVG